MANRAHARTGDIAKIAGYIGNSDAITTALADFAEAYGDQTERDHAALVDAVRSGRVVAVHENESWNRSEKRNLGRLGPPLWRITRSGHPRASQRGVTHQPEA
jgi:acetyl-CoA carboxylase alpha subunit